MERVDIKNVIVIALVAGSGTNKGKFLFVKEKNGAILFPGGKVKNGETLSEALKRECNEETGLSCVIGKLVCIEHASIWEHSVQTAARSMLLYFFNARVAGELQPHGNNVLWMDERQIENVKSTVPYDNLLIAGGLGTIEMGHHYVVPEGFLDSPGDPNHVVVRTFSWINA